jgi:hypothetical protein
MAASHDPEARGCAYLACPIGSAPDPRHKAVFDVNEPRKKKSLSPILDQIAHGGSSVALNLIRLTALAPDRHMFRQESLNRTVIFKYPNFEQQIADQPTLAQAQDPKAAAAKSTLGKPAEPPPPPVPERPIETAIYVPYNSEQVGAGGYGIYLRQREFERLLKDHVGIDFETKSEAFERDVAILRTIDSVPSLDPFLLKSALLRFSADIHPAYFAISESEEESIKVLIASKVNPIVARALGLKDDADVNERSQRFLLALWDPSMPEAKLFVSAFGISGEQASLIFEGWKGVTFYEHTFTRNLHQVAGVLRWLTSSDATPIDSREFKHYKDQQDMFRQAVVKKLRNLIANVNGIFAEYTECHGKFLHGGDAKPFRNFLAGVYRRYWVLGYCSMAVLHTCNIHERFMREAIQNRLRFEQIEEMLKRMDASLSSQANAAI